MTEAEVKSVVVDAEVHADQEAGQDGCMGTAVRGDLVAGERAQFLRGWLAGTRTAGGRPGTGPAPQSGGGLSCRRGGCDVCGGGERGEGRGRQRSELWRAAGGGVG